MKTGIVTAVSHEGRGIIKAEGAKTTFVDFALLGEKVTYEVYAEKSKFNEAKAVTILKPSDKRVVPPCPYFGTCGGCSLQHMAHSEQIQLKQNTLLEHLKHYAHMTPQRVLEPLLGPVWHYRHKAQLTVQYQPATKKAILGFKQSNSHEVVNIDACLILPPHINCAELCTLINRLSIVDAIPTIDVAVGEDATALIVHHTKPLTEADETKIRHFAQKHSFQFYLQSQGRASVTKFYPEDDEDFLSYTVAGVDLHFHPADFTQINPEINQKMVAQALTLLDLQSTDHVLDLYCGMGNFSLPIAKKVASVTGIEGVDTMVKRARDNAALNKITNAQFFKADLQKNKITWTKKAYTKLVIDPPRTGGNMALVLSLKIPHIVYISCDAATLARDAKVLSENGYALTAAGIMDMFPHTKHVESMAVFQFG